MLTFHLHSHHHDVSNWKYQKNINQSINHNVECPISTNAITTLRIRLLIYPMQFLHLSLSTTTIKSHNIQPVLDPQNTLIYSSIEKSGENVFLY